MDKDAAFFEFYDKYLESTMDLPKSLESRMGLQRSLESMMGLPKSLESRMGLPKSIYEIVNSYRMKPLEEAKQTIDKGNSDEKKETGLANLLPANTSYNVNYNSKLELAGKGLIAGSSVIGACAQYFTKKKEAEVKIQEIEANERMNTENLEVEREKIALTREGQNTQYNLAIMKEMGINERHKSEQTRLSDEFKENQENFRQLIKKDNDQFLMNLEQKKAKIEESKRKHEVKTQLECQKIALDAQNAHEDRQTRLKEAEISKEKKFQELEVELEKTRMKYADRKEEREAKYQQMQKERENHQNQTTFLLESMVTFGKLSDSEKDFFKNLLMSQQESAKEYNTAATLCARRSSKDKSKREHKH